MSASPGRKRKADSLDGDRPVAKAVAHDQVSKEMPMPPLILSSDSHVFEPPDLWQTRIDAEFRDRAPRIQRIDGSDQIVVETDQILSGIGLISNAGARFEAPENISHKDASKTCFREDTTPSNISGTGRSMESPVKSSIRRKGCFISRWRTGP